MTLNNGSRLSGLVFLSLTLLGELVAQPAFEPASFQSSAQMVLVPVAVTDHAGKTMNGLRQEAFTVFDEQLPQRILSFSSEDAPCSVGVVLDTSGSMRYALSVAKDVAHAFLKTANPEDEFLLMTIATRPDTISGFTPDAAALEQEIQSARSGGLTALIDTVYLGLGNMRHAGRSRRALLIISDGMDNYSRYSKKNLLRKAIEADVQIYTIILDNSLNGGQATGVPFRPGMKKPIDQGKERQGPAMLEELAEKTGGLHFRVRNDAQTQTAANKVGQALRNQYLIGYRPPEAKPAGKWRRVRVKLAVPNANVYARDGYYSQ